MILWFLYKLRNKLFTVVETTSTTEYATGQHVEETETKRTVSETHPNGLFIHLHQNGNIKHERTKNREEEN